jgi:hypothetical protein
METSYNSSPLFVHSMHLNIRMFYSHHNHCKWDDCDIALLEDVQHVDLLIKLNNVQVTFGILIHWFMQWPLYLLRYKLLFSTFIDSLVSFDSSLLQMFGCLLGPWSFNSPKGPLVRKHVSFLIIFDGIGLIPIATITPTTCLRNWAFVTSIIVAKFFIDQQPFFFETLTQVYNNAFPFQQHFKVTCDFILFLTWVYFFPFEQLIR